MPLRRRAGWLVALAGLALVIGAGGGRADDAVLAQAARKESAVTWYVASLSPQNAQAAGHVFTKKYGIRASVVSAPAQVIFQRLTQNLSQNANDADVFSSLDLGNFVTLKEEGALAAYVPENAGKLLPLFRGLDEDGTFQATVASVMLIAYNREKLTAANAPKTWADMLDPKWSGKIVLVHPAFSVPAATWAVQVNKMYGRRYFEEVRALRPEIARSVSGAVEMVASGERLITAAPAAIVLQDADLGDPISIQYPRDGAILITSPSAVLKSAPHPNAARLFMNFLLGPDFGAILVRAHYEARRDNVTFAAGGKSLSGIKLIRPTIADMTTSIPQVTGLWRDVFGK